MWERRFNQPSKFPHSGEKFRWTPEYLCVLLLSMPSLWMSICSVSLGSLGCHTAGRHRSKASYHNVTPLWKTPEREFTVFLAYVWLHRPVITVHRSVCVMSDEVSRAVWTLQTLFWCRPPRHKGSFTSNSASQIFGTGGISRPSPLFCCHFPVCAHQRCPCKDTLSDYYLHSTMPPTHHAPVTRFHK